MKRRLLLIPFFAIAFSLYSSIVFGNETFEGEKAKKIIEILASKEFEGRQAGLPGGRKAGDWIAERFKEFGFEPGGDEKTYFQKFKIDVIKHNPPVHLSCSLGKGKNKEYKYTDDYLVLAYSGSARVKGQAVFAGYGISAKDKDFDEYKELDVKGKIVIAFRGAPVAGWETEKFIGYKAKTAREHGAVGFILIENEKPTSGNIQAQYYAKDFAGVWASLEAAAEMLGVSGKDLIDLRKKIDEKCLPESFATKNEVTIETHSEYIKDAEARNVIGIIPGNDPFLKDEYVLVTAHMDHLGISVTGEVFGGANDNASGTATMLEIARLMSVNKVVPKRTIVFIAFDAEEIGIQGSKFMAKINEWTDHIVAVLNMDMVGQGSGTGVSFVNLPWFPAIDEILEARLPQALEKLINKGAYEGGASDQAYFMPLGIPAFHIMSSGNHGIFHSPEDTADKILPAALDCVGKVIYESAVILAGYPEPLLRKDRKLYFRYFKKNYIKLGTFSPKNIPDLRRAGFDFLVDDVNIKKKSSAAEILNMIAGEIELIKKYAADNPRKAVIIEPAKGYGAASSNRKIGVGLRITGALPLDFDFSKLPAGCVFWWRSEFNTKTDGLDENEKAQIALAAKHNILVEISGLKGAKIKTILESGYKFIYVANGFNFPKELASLSVDKKNLMILIRLPSEGRIASVTFKKMPEIAGILKSRQWNGIPAALIFGGTIKRRENDCRPAENIYILVRMAEDMGIPEGDVKKLFGDALLDFMVPPKKDDKKPAEKK